MIASDKGYAETVPLRIRDALCSSCGHRESSHSTPTNDREYRKRAAVRCAVWAAGVKCECPEFVFGGDAA